MTQLQPEIFQLKVRLNFVKAKVEVIVSLFLAVIKLKQCNSVELMSATHPTFLKHKLWGSLQGFTDTTTWPVIQRWPA